MATLYIIRGVSGSGKSTLAAKIADRHDDTERPVVFSTDDFFVTEGPLDGKPAGYHFDVSLLDAAHKWNYGRAVRAMRESRNVIIDNTNTRPWEYERYVKFAEALGYDISIENVHGEVSEKTLHLFHGRNRHGVPFEVIEAQYARFSKTLRREGAELKEASDG